MDYQELLFAAEVRKAAVDMYRMRRKEIIENHPQEGTLGQRLAEWEAQHPFEHWFVEAYKSITWAASVVRDLRQKESSTGA